jgi:hypothetical protein
VPGKDPQSRRESLQAATSRQLSAIVEAAERAASQVIDDAEREAQRRLAEAESQAAERLATLTAEVDALTAQANELRFRTQELLVGLSRLRTELEPGQPAGPDLPPTPEGWTGYGPKVVPRGSHLSAVAPDPEPAGEPEPAAPPANGGAGARLLATQMAISGSSREEIAERLRNGFQIDDPEAILEAILGPEG